MSWIEWYDAPTVPSHLVDGVDLSAVRLFLAVAELGSVAKAARRVGISQPSATAKLRKLERLLGVPLLERSATGSGLTAAGRVIAEAAGDLVVSATALMREAQRARDGEQRLRVAATRSIIDHRLDSYLERAALGDVVIDVSDFDTRTVASSVRAGRVGIGLLDGPNPPLGLRSVIVGRFELVAVAADDGPARRSASALVAGRLIVRRDGSGTRDVVESALAEHGFGGAGRLVEVSTTAGVLATARSGAGVAIVPSDDAAADLNRGSLRKIKVSDVAFEQPIRLCWSGSQPARRLAQSLVNALT